MLSRTLVLVVARRRTACYCVLRCVLLLAVRGGDADEVRRNRRGCASDVVFVQRTYFLERAY